jgi:molecular chaperone DnaJ
MDFYVLLGIDRGASLGDIKRAYRRLARRYHPDINPGDSRAAQQFRQIATAYETLSNPETRRRYDTTGEATDRSDPPTYGFEGFDFSVSVGGASAPTFGDLFADVLRQRDARQGASGARGSDLHATLSFSFEDALVGGRRQLVVTRQHQCRACLGSGVIGTADHRCDHCEGTGTVKAARGYMVFTRPCPRCGGTGTQASARCPSCGGLQTEMRTEPLMVNVPAGLEDGARIRLPHKGHAGRDGGEPGDLYVTVRVEPHPLLRREGDDLHITVPVAIHEAALGAKVDVPVPGGVARLRVPPGTQAGQRFRLRERGVLSARSGRRGDLVVEVRLVLPKLLDERSKELLREFGRINHEDVRKDLAKVQGGQVT